MYSEAGWKVDRDTTFDKKQIAVGAATDKILRAHVAFLQSRLGSKSLSLSRYTEMAIREAILKDIEVMAELQQEQEQKQERKRRAVPKFTK